jgi:DNA-binding response OmpR family regulator
MKKILLIEDDRVIRESTAELLELEGYHMLTAENGKKGIEIAKEYDPELIICDIMMPEVDGYGVFDILSKDASTSTIPFIFLTAKTEESEILKGIELGAADYLTKPFKVPELLVAIETKIRN